MKIFRCVFAFFLLFSSAAMHAQLPVSGWHQWSNDSISAAMNGRKFTGHTVIQPAAWGLDDETYNLLDSSYATQSYRRGLSLRPMFDASGGVGFTDKTLFAGSGHVGLFAEWKIENRLKITLGAAAHVLEGPTYLRKIADSMQLITGVGYNVSDSGVTPMSFVPFGSISYTLGKYFNVEVGRGKHFWGDEHRSLILSDVAPAYPYARLTTKIWRIKYTNLWAMMKDISFGQDIRDARKKFVALHSLSWNVAKWLNVSAFEMVVWQDRDTLSNRTLDLNYLNPVIFYRPVEFAQGSADNVLLGAGFKAKMTPKVQFYGQVVLDEFVLNKLKLRTGWWANKFGGQLGLRFFDAFTPGLHIRTEWNLVRPFTYTHGSPIQAWGHMNQPLAHPMGANFYEWLNVISYSTKTWNFNYEFIWAAYGRDRDGLNQGGNIFRSYRSPYRQYDNVMLQGVKSTFHFSKLEVAKHIFPKFGTQAYFTYGWRFEKNEFGQYNEHFIQLGIRIPVNRTTSDF